jgi:hypothetical protein
MIYKVNKENSNKQNIDKIKEKYRKYDKSYINMKVQDLLKKQEKEGEFKGNIIMYKIMRIKMKISYHAWERKVSV